MPPLPVSANAAEPQSGISKAQLTDVSAQRHWRSRHYGYPYYGPRRFYGPRYGYYGYPYRPYRYDYYGGYPYAYAPGIGVGIGPFGFRIF